MSETKPTEPATWKRLAINLSAAGAAALRWPWLRLTGREPDPYRRTLGLGLRSTGSHFGLSAFNLAVPAAARDAAAAESTEDGLARHFRDFLAADANARWSLRQHPSHVERIAAPGIDLSVGHFGVNGALDQLSVLLDPAVPCPLATTDRHRLNAIVIAAYHTTTRLNDPERPRALLDEALRRVGGGNHQADYVRRVVSAPFLSIEPQGMWGTDRFAPPEFHRRRPPGHGVIHALARLAPDGRSADFWFDLHHVGIDGAPAQELLSHLEQQWGHTGPTQFPIDDPGRPAMLQSAGTDHAGQPVALLVDFVDLSPLLQWRTRVNRRLPTPLPVTAALLWQLAHQPEFAGRTFSTAVDVPPDSRWPRAVDLVAITPGDYFASGSGLAAYAREYTERVEAGRHRRSRSFGAMRSLALVPPALAVQTLRVNPARTRTTFGTVGLSMLKEAAVFTAPMADHGWEDGFIAIGSAALPTSGPARVAAITVKGCEAQIRTYPGAFRRAMRECIQHAPRADG